MASKRKNLAAALAAFAAMAAAPLAVATVCIPAPAAAQAPFDLNALNADVRNAAQQARSAERTARDVATQARAGTRGRLYDYAPDGPQYAGYFYEGDWVTYSDGSGTRQGYGYWYAAPPNQFAGWWYAGQWNEGTYNGYGVMVGGNGIRYEGVFVNGQNQGLGVEWSATGQILHQGIWSNGALITPLSR